MSDYSELKRLASAATPQNFDSAETKDENGYAECPCCNGEGAVLVEADYCNYDDVALGVQFYGIGKEFGDAEAYYRAANPAAILALIDELESYQMSASHQLVKGIVGTFVSEAASGVAAACKASTESGLIATLECAQGDLRQAMQIIEKQQGLLRRVIDSSVLSFEQDGPELLVSLEADICAAIKPATEPEHICDGCGSSGWTGSCDKCIPY